MTPKEAWKKEFTNWKSLPAGRKWKYIWTNYPKMLVISVLVILAAVVILVRHEPAKDSALGIVTINTTATQSEYAAYKENLIQQLGLDTDRETVTVYSSLYFLDQELSTSYESAYTLFAMIGAGNVDILAGDEETMVSFAYLEYLADLANVLPEDRFAQWEPYMLYADQALIQQENEDLDGSGITVFPDPVAPDAMTDPVPVLLRLPAESGFAQAFYPGTKQDVVIGIAANIPQQENISHFLEVLWEEMRE